MPAPRMHLFWCRNCHFTTSLDTAELAELQAGSVFQRPTADENDDGLDGYSSPICECCEGGAEADEALFCDGLINRAEVDRREFERWRAAHPFEGVRFSLHRDPYDLADELHEQWRAGAFNE